MSDGGQKNTTHDSAIGWLILGGIFFVIGLLLWHFFEYQIKDAMRWLRVAEIKMVGIFFSEDYRVDIDGELLSPVAAVDDIQKLQAEELDGTLINVISRLALEPVRMPIAIIIGLMGMWALMFGPGTQYRRKMNIDGLINAQAKNFPVIQPFIKFNPATMPPRPPGSPVPAELPLFAEALGPEEWVAYNQIPVPDGKLDEDVAFIAFAKQLGPRWQGPLKLPAYKQILLAACCLKAARKRGDSDNMLGRLAMCWSSEKGLQLAKDKNLIKEARAVLKNKSLAGSTLAKCNQHAFHTTALLRALQTAREEGGVLAPAQFVWLRGYDRNLWYPLNNLGRQAYHIEAMGAMAHFKAEKMTQRPIPKPKVGDAIGSISEYMNSARARPIPQLDYSKSKKRGVKQPKAQAGVKKPTKK